MHKTIRAFFFTGLATVFLAANVAWAQPKPQPVPSSVNLAQNAVSAILIDADTGTVLYEKNSRLKLPPASITKIMTLLLVMEAIDRGKIKLTDKVRVSEYAASMGGSQIFLEPGEEMTVEDLIKGVAVASGNDASVALAEYVAGTEEAFVAMMNEKARQLGMTDTRFANSNGLPAPDHYTSARDIAIMSRELLKYEAITKYTGLYQDYLRKDTNRPFWLVNTNRLVRFYPGCDGLKTGYTSEAKFCLSATAKRDNFRVIAVVLGEPDTKTRNAEVAKMFDYAFSQYTTKPLYQRGDVIQELPVEKGERERLPVVAARHFNLLMKRGEDAGQYQTTVELPERVLAPVKAGDVLGHVVVTKQGQEVARLDLVAPVDVGAATFGQLWQRALNRLLHLPDAGRANGDERNNREAAFDKASRFFVLSSKGRNGVCR
ncbi:D-alanyl-D-alanine carboxypeptidase family protein [Calditerricola satsumensis]|nr:D-alanyl-D-alanine carboxypeptidase family protein [Calditerricola satsumensis]